MTFRDEDIYDVLEVALPDACQQSHAVGLAKAMLVSLGLLFNFV